MCAGGSLGCLSCCPWLGCGWRRRVVPVHELLPGEAGSPKPQSPPGQPIVGEVSRDEVGLSESQPGLLPSAVVELRPGSRGAGEAPLFAESIESSPCPTPPPAGLLPLDPLGLTSRRGSAALSAGAGRRLSVPSEGRGATPDRSFRPASAGRPMLPHLGAPLRLFEPKVPPEGDPAFGGSPKFADLLKPCVVCMEAARTIMFLPCHHSVCCVTCARQLNRCPVCNDEFDDVDHGQFIQSYMQSMPETEESDAP
eukprot:EG_transcript_14297